MRVGPAILLLASLSFLSSCGLFKSESSGVEEFQQQTRNIYIKVLSEDDSPIPVATVKVAVDQNSNGVFEDAEEVTLSTDENGNTPKFSVSEDKNVRLVVSAPSHATFFRVYDSAIQMPAVLNLYKAEKINVNGPNIANGKVEVYVGNAQALGIRSAEIAVVNPGENPQNMPGGFVGTTQQGTVILSSSGVFQVRFYDQNGFPIDPGNGNYPIRVKIESENIAGLEDVNPETPQIEIPLWYLDERTGVWKEYATHAVIVDKNNRMVDRKKLSEIITEMASSQYTNNGVNFELYAIGSVSHFSIINLDYPSSRGQLCGQVENAPPGGGYIVVDGVNWNGQTVTQINPNGVTCIGVPRNNQNPRSGNPTNPDCKGGYHRVLKDMLSALYYHGYQNPNAPPEVRRKIQFYMDSMMNAAINALDVEQVKYLKNWTNAEAVNQEIQRMQEIRDKLILAKNNGFIENFINTYSAFSRTYAQNVQAEDLAKIEQELVSRYKKNVIDAVVPIATEFFTDKTFGDIIHALKYSRPTACQGIITEKVAEAAINELTSRLQQAAGVGGDELPPALSGFVVITRTISENIGPGGEIGIIYYRDTRRSEIRFTNDYMQCLRELGLLKANALNPMVRESLQNALGRVSILATGLDLVLKSTLDTFDAQTSIKDLAVANQVYTQSLIVRSNLLRLLRDVSGYFDYTRRVEWDRLPDECKDTKAFHNFISDFFGVQPMGPRKKLNVKDTQSEYPEHLQHALTLMLSVGYLLDTAEMLKYKNRALIEERSAFWYDIATNQVKKGLPSNGAVVGRPFEYGGYVSRIGFSPKYGTKYIPIKVFTDMGHRTDRLPSPGGDFGLWIGKIDLRNVRLGIEQIDLNLTISAPQDADLRILSVDNVYLRGDYYAPAESLSCNVSSNRASCRFNALLLLDIDKIDLTLSVNGQRVSKTLKVGQTINERAININKELVWCGESLIIQSSSIPDVIEPNRVYTLRVTTLGSRYIEDRSACRETGGEPRIEWFMGALSLGEGNEVSLRTPDKRTLSYIGREVAVGVHACIGNRCSTSSKIVKVQTNNQPPRIVSFNIPASFAPNVREYTPDVRVEDPDGDEFSLEWSSSNENVIVPGEKFLINHFNRDMQARICLRATDGIDSAVRCIDVVSQRFVPKPEINGVFYALTNYTVPTRVKFAVNFSTNAELGRVEYSDGTRTMSFDKNQFEVEYTRAGKYDISIRVIDTTGQASEPYQLTLNLYEGVSLSATASILKLKDDGTPVVRINTTLEGQRRPTPIDYGIDTNGDGVVDYLPSFIEGSYFEVNLPESLTSESIRVIVHTDVGQFVVNIPISSVQPYVKLFANPNRGAVPLTVSFDTQAFAFGASPVEYAYDYDGDGRPEAIINQSRSTYTYNTSGTYTPKVSVLFRNGLRAQDTSTVVVESIPTITLSTLGRGISSDGRVVVGYRNDGGSYVPYYWIFKQDAVRSPFMFLEDQSKFERRELPSPQQYAGSVIVKNLSAEGLCAVGYAFGAESSVPIMWRIDTQSENVTLQELPSSCSVGNIAYD
ncbi:MAG: PKD domain-containing protein [Aquificaceae bacterium]|nr:PKD domain-containing protein [Aquificaceae bacterium]